ncbi:MAG: DUF4157 domain-containing protein [Proteobacteria bacterium]|nr:DUF4157 domain-containing protein [Pseudomonadota bacterium]
MSYKDRYRSDRLAEQWFEEEESSSRSATNQPDRELVAHELTHVVQFRQAGRTTGSVAAKGGVSNPGDAAEREANALARRAAQGHVVTVSARPGVGLHRSLQDNIRRALRRDDAPMEVRVILAWSRMIVVHRENPDEFTTEVGQLGPDEIGCLLRHVPDEIADQDVFRAFLRIFGPAVATAYLPDQRIGLLIDSAGPIDPEAQLALLQTLFTDGRLALVVAQASAPRQAILRAMVANVPAAIIDPLLRDVMNLILDVTTDAELGKLCMSRLYGPTFAGDGGTDHGIDPLPDPAAEE